MSIAMFKWRFDALTVTDIHGTAHRYSAKELRNITYGDKRDDACGARMIWIGVRDDEAIPHCITLAELRRLMDIVDGTSQPGTGAN